MRISELRGGLRGVRDIATLTIVAILVEESAPRWRLQRLRFPLRINGAEEEETVLDDWPPAFHAGIMQLRRQRLHGSVDRLVLLPRALEALRPGVAEQGTPKVVRAALRDDIHHPADGLAELRLVAPGLHLDFLEEVERYRVTERAEDDRVRAERAEPLIGDVHAIDDILIVQSAGAGNRRVLPSDRSGVAHARQV